MESISNYINGLLREYVQRQTNIKLTPISISYDSDNKKLIFGNGEYSELLKKDYLNVINDIINKTNQKAGRVVIESNNLSQSIDQSTQIVVNRELYFDILPDEILIEILKYTLGFDYFDKYMKISEIDKFGKLLQDEGINQLLFYYLVPEYSNIKNFYIFDNIDSWKHAFDVAYRNIYPPKESDIKMVVRNKDVMKPIENAYTYHAFGKIKNVKYDNKGLPVKFNIEYYDTHNQIRTGVYVIDNNEYERKSTKWYYKGDDDDDFQLLRTNTSYIQTITKKLMMYYRKYPKLFIPWVGIKFSIHELLGSYFLYQVISIKWDVDYPSEIIAENIIESQQGKNTSDFKRLTVIPNENLNGYMIKEFSTFDDKTLTQIYWNADFKN